MAFVNWDNFFTETDEGHVFQKIGTQGVLMNDKEKQEFISFFDALIQRITYTMIILLQCLVLFIAAWSRPVYDLFFYIIGLMFLIPVVYYFGILNAWVKDFPVCKVGTWKEVLRKKRQPTYNWSSETRFILLASLLLLFSVILSFVGGWGLVDRPEVDDPFAMNSFAAALLLSSPCIALNFFLRSRVQSGKFSDYLSHRVTLDTKS